jgi:hypothetical protein
MEIGDNGNNDEERRIQQSREQNRVTQERKRASEPMRTFEAKLSEKASHEAGLKDSAARQSRQQQKDTEERESLIEKIIGAASSKEDEDAAHATDKARVSGKKFEDEHDSSRREAEYEDRVARHSDDLDGTTDKKSSTSGDKKKSEVSEEGYRRVAEKQDDGEAGGFGGGMGGDAGGHGAGSGTQGGGSGFGSGGQNPKENLFAKDLMARQALQPVRKGSDSGRGFQQNAKPFTPRDLDGIVSKVEVGLKGDGEEFFSVELSDRYFDGLKLKAVRTEQGVVVKFLCPNVSVRSTFLKYRPAVIARLKEKGIAVFRVDVA